MLIEGNGQGFRFQSLFLLSVQRALIVASKAILFTAETIIKITPNQDKTQYLLSFSTLFYTLWAATVFSQPMACIPACHNCYGGLGSLTSETR